MSVQNEQSNVRVAVVGLHCRNSGSRVYNRLCLVVKALIVNSRSVLVAYLKVPPKTVERLSMESTVYI